MALRNIKVTLRARGISRTGISQQERMDFKRPGVIIIRTRKPVFAKKL